MFLDISEGVRHLHAHHLVHRDLAARNLLVSGTGSIKVRARAWHTTSC
jgi:serine/threonine protein kinase